jgi:hypothetical protein
MRFSKARTHALALGIVLLFAAGTASADSVGFVAVAQGDVQVQRYGTNSFEAAVQDMEVSVGDTIRTGVASKAKILLVDDTTLSIDEETEITIQSLHVGAAATQDRSIIKQTRGRLRTVVGSAFGGPTRLEVHTPTAVVGVKGTDFTSEEEEDQQGKEQWLYCLVDGKIVVTTETSLGEPKPGYCVYAYENGDISEEFEARRAPLSIDFSGAIAGFGGSDLGTPPVGAGGPGEGGGGLGPEIENFDPPDPGDLGLNTIIEQDKTMIDEMDEMEMPPEGPEDPTGNL